jgi:hypothetical protein
MRHDSAETTALLRSEADAARRELSATQRDAGAAAARADIAREQVASLTAQLDGLRGRADMLQEQVGGMRVFIVPAVGLGGGGGMRGMVAHTR